MAQFRRAAKINYKTITEIRTFGRHFKSHKGKLLTNNYGHEGSLERSD